MSMANFAHLLERYGAMQRLSQQMLELATRGEWDALAEAGTARTSIEEELRQVDAVAWRGPQATSKEELINAILALDAQTRTLTEARLKELHQVIGSVGTEKKLNKAYGQA